MRMYVLFQVSATIHIYYTRVSFGIFFPSARIVGSFKIVSSWVVTKFLESVLFGFLTAICIMNFYF